MRNPRKQLWGNDLRRYIIEIAVTYRKSLSHYINQMKWNSQV